MRTISVCITTFNRLEFTIESFKNVLQDERVNEIVISDDASDLPIYEKLKTFCEGIPKVKLWRNASTQGCYQNKMIAVSHSSNDFCIIFDSDNVIDSSYIDELYKIPDWDKHTTYHADFAMPHFDYTGFDNVTLTKENVASYIPQFKFDCLINTCNYFVNRDEYLRVFDHSHKEPFAADSIIQNYNWLSAGNKIFVVPHMQYQHTVHNGSHFKEHQHKSLELAHQYEEKLKQLK